jgi:hypothetical protein
MVAVAALGCTNRGTSLIGDLSRSTILVSPAQVPADGVSRATIVITLMTSTGNVVAHVPVSLKQTSPLGTVTDAAPTDGRGVAQAYATSLRPGTMTVAAWVDFQGFVIPLPGAVSIVYVDPDNVQGGTTTSGTAGTSTTGGSTGGTSASTSSTGGSTAATTGGSGATSTTGGTGGSTTGGGVATQLAFTRQPGNSMPATCNITPAPTVTFEDASGTPVTADANTVSVALGSNPGGATLGGSSTVAAINGVATFNGLTVSALGSGYTLVASAAGMSSVTSAPFDVAGTCAPTYITTPTTLAGAVAGVATGDFNGDGNRDVLVYNKGTPSQEINFLYGDGTGHFPSNDKLTLPFTVPNIQTADFNGDRYTDFAVVDPTRADPATSGTVYLNHRDGTFDASAVGLGVNPSYLTLFDTDMDGSMDLIAGTQSGSAVWLLGTGLGTFGNSNSLNITTHPVMATYLGNFGAAGAFRSICVYEASGAYTTYYKAGPSQLTTSGPAMAQTKWGSTWVFASALNSSASAGTVNLACFGSGSLSAFGTNNFVNNGASVAAGDITGDGNPEFLLSSNSGVSAVTGQANCSTPPLSGVVYNTGHPAIGVDATDFDNNGSVDMVTANADDNSVTVITMP